MSRHLRAGDHNWSAYSPDVPGCASTGKTRTETKENFRRALRLHLEGLAEDGLPIPEPSGAQAGVVTVAA
ncbi:MAG: type II toxin-antitoxin system HicB family antitoxin [Armatimonadota bacterium]|nr:type II toxin-antitoxin system HicB family antitoxin [Armatimonadota bacterium]